MIVAVVISVIAIFALLLFSEYFFEKDDWGFPELRKRKK
jgi:hypothetical protein